MQIDINIWIESTGYIDLDRQFGKRWIYRQSLIDKQIYITANMVTQIDLYVQITRYRYIYRQMDQDRYTLIYI